MNLFETKALVSERVSRLRNENGDYVLPPGVLNSLVELCHIGGEMQRAKEFIERLEPRAGVEVGA